MSSKMVGLHTLKPNERNPRKITSDALKKLCESIERDPAFMELRPIIIDESRMILGGNQRFRACQQLGMKSVPSAWVRTATGLTEEQRKRFILVDNAPDGMAGEWDMEILAAEWQIPELGDLGFDLDDLAASLPTNEDVDAEPQIDRAEELRNEWGVESGQLWALGEHRLLCGDSTNVDDYCRLFAKGVAPKLVFTDPPYGIAYKAMRGGTAIANDGNLETAANVVRDALALTVEAESHFLCCDWRSMPMMLATMTDAGLEPKACVVWDKMRGVQNLDRFHKQHEFILYAGPYGGEKTVCGDVWAHARDFEPDHPTPKPVPLVAQAIEATTSRGDTVFDAFLGSGATLIACEQLGRKCRAIELSPGYVAVALQRFKDATGKTPTLEGHGS